MTSGCLWIVKAGRRHFSKGKSEATASVFSVYYPYDIAQCYKLLFSLYRLVVQCIISALHNVSLINQSHAEFYSVAAQLFLQSASYPLLGFWLVPGFSTLKFSISQLPRLHSSHFSYERRDNLLATSVCLIIITARSKFPAFKSVIAQ